jgi:hypothetical protein
VKPLDRLSDTVATTSVIIAPTRSRWLTDLLGGHTWREDAEADQVNQRKERDDHRDVVALQLKFSALISTALPMRGVTPIPSIRASIQMRA